MKTKTTIKDLEEEINKNSRDIAWGFVLSWIVVAILVITAFCWFIDIEQKIEAYQNQITDLNTKFQQMDLVKVWVCDKTTIETVSNQTFCTQTYPILVPRRETEDVCVEWKDKISPDIVEELVRTCIAYCSYPCKKVFDNCYWKNTNSQTNCFNDTCIIFISLREDIIKKCEDTLNECEKQCDNTKDCLNIKPICTRTELRLKGAVPELGTRLK